MRAGDAVSGLTVERPGALASAQDLGRFGHGSLGVAVSGAADRTSLRLGNRLVGNPDGAAAVETALVGGVFRFEDEREVALTGAPCGATIVSAAGARDAPMWRAVRVHAGETVACGSMRGGLRTYLCVAGGVETPPVLGSRSTHATTGFGSPHGRTLRAGDRLPLGRVFARRGRPGTGDANALRSLIRALVRGEAPARVRAVWGTPGERVSEAAREAFGRAQFQISPRSDRVGARLEGATIDADGLGAMAAEGMVRGAVQVWPGGGLVVLGADGSPTGGYPVIACVAGVDLDAFAQRPLGTAIGFDVIGLDEARRLLAEREALVERAVPTACEIDLNADVGEDPESLADGRERALIECLSSVNIACGGHAGDERTMREVVRLALACGCAIGAHPSYPDRAGFGRRPMEMTPEALEAAVRAQIAALGEIARAAGAKLAHVKPHGALYHAADRDAEIAAAIGRAAVAWDPRLAMVGSAGGAALGVWRSMGLRAIGEGFADRAYAPGGGLVARTERHALIEDQAGAGEQALGLAERGEAVAFDGSVVRAPCATVCVHGDTPGAAAIARGVRSALDARGIVVRAAGGR